MSFITYPGRRTHDNLTRPFERQPYPDMMRRQSWKCHGCNAIVQPGTLHACPRGI